MQKTKAVKVENPIIRNDSGKEAPGAFKTFRNAGIVATLLASSVYLTHRVDIRPFELAMRDANQHQAQINKDIQTGSRRVSTEERIAAMAELYAAEAFREYRNLLSPQNLEFRGAFRNIARQAIQEANDNGPLYKEGMTLTIYKYDPLLEDKSLGDTARDGPDGHYRDFKHSEISLNKTKYLIAETTDHGPKNNPKVNDKRIDVLGRIVYLDAPPSGTRTYALQKIDVSEQRLITPTIINSYSDAKELGFNGN